MKVTLTRRWAMHRAGKQVEVSDSQGRWLIQHAYAESTDDVRAPKQDAAAPGANGPDPLAGADATRRRMRMTAPERDPDRNYARQAEGSSPTYRAGFDADAAERQGVAGRNFDPKQDHGRPAVAVEGSVAADQEAARSSATREDGAGDGDGDVGATDAGDQPTTRKRAARRSKTDDATRS